MSKVAPICQSRLAVAPWMDPLAARLPGLQPVAEGEWLQRDDAFDGQMAYRDSLLAERTGEVAVTRGSAAEAALLDAVLAELKDAPGYLRRGEAIERPDGVAVRLDAGQPLITAARLVQEDLLLMEEIDGAYALTSAVLCFPASWTLGQKMGHGLGRIHMPVERYDEAMGKRVERVFAMLQPGKAVWRANVLCYNDPELHQPRMEHERRPFDAAKPVWVRVERQTLMKLAPGNAVVFGIHTHLVPIEALTAEQAAGLPDVVRRGGSMGETN